MGAKMDAWQAILTAFGGTAALLLLLGFLARSAIKHFLDKDVEAFKADLKSKETLAAEQFKASLARASVEHQATFTRLLDKRAEVIGNLHGRLVDLRTTSIKATAVVRWPSDPAPLVQLAEADRIRVDLISYFAKNRIYLPVAACVALDDLLEVMRKKMISFGTFQEVNEYAPAEVLQEKQQNWRETFEFFSRELDTPIRELEDAFRTLLYPADDRSASSS